MTNSSSYQKQLTENGFAILPGIYSGEEVQQILQAIEQADTSGQAFRKTADLFAIRQFLKAIPETIQLVFNENLRKVVQELFGENFFVVKSIYFDKPETSNWFVAWHQDLTISVDNKDTIPGFGPWTVKHNQFAVRPTTDILENIFTVRIHLDDTNDRNGALKVIPGSHAKGIYRPETIDWTIESETTCTVRKGGIMIMKPLLLHSSGKSTDNRRRRVIHIEFSHRELPAGIQWAEKLVLNF